MKLEDKVFKLLLIKPQSNFKLKFFSNISSLFNLFIKELKSFIIIFPSDKINFGRFSICFFD
jgi:hypothetical protein